jgi:hypothetical protein
MGSAQNIISFCQHTHILNHDLKAASRCTASCSLRDPCGGVLNTSTVALGVVVGDRKGPSAWG